MRCFGPGAAQSLLPPGRSAKGKILAGRAEWDAPWRRTKYVNRHAWDRRPGCSGIFPQGGQQGGTHNRQDAAHTGTQAQGQHQAEGCRKV